MVYLRNIFLMLCVCVLSVAKLSAQVTPITPAKPLNNQEDVELRLMMVDALLELNDAMLQGVKASKDTLNLPENAQTIKEKDMQTTLIRMKRMRDRTLLMPYLEHIEDSIKNEIVLLEKEKKVLQAALNPMTPLQPVAVKTDMVVAGKDTLVVHTTIDPTTGQSTQTLHDVIVSDATASAAESKKEKKKKQPKGYIPMDTVLVFDLGSMKSAPEPARQVPVITKPDTAAFAKAMSDTAGIMIKLPGSEDSIVIKPVRGRKREPSVFVDSVITPEVTSPYISDVANLSPDSVNKIKAAFFMQRVSTAMYTKDYKTAETYLNKTLEVQPNNLEAWMAKADMEASTGNDNAALNSYKRANELDSTKAVVHYGMAMIYIRGKKSTDALKELDKAIKLNSKYVEALMERAAIYKANKRYLESIVEYNKVVKADITHYQAYRERGMVKMLVKDFDQAADDFTRYLIFEPNEAWAYYNRALCRIESKEFEDGCSDLATAKEKGSKDADKAIKKYCKQ